MKKYLMTAVAALSLGGFMTSCTHDVDGSSSSGDIATNAQESYEQAFLNTFGRPIEGFDWGFGNASAASRATTRAKGDYDSYRGSTTPQEWYQDTSDGQWKIRPYTFPSAPASIPTSRPNDAEYYGGGYKYYEGATIYMDENTSNHVEVQGYCDMYVVKTGTGDGNITIESSSYWYVGNVPYGSGKKIRVFVCPGVTLKIPTKDAGNLQANVEYYIASGAKLECDTRLKLNGTSLFVAPNAEVTCNSFEINNDCVFYNQGTLTTTGGVYVANGTSVIVNDGTIVSGTANNPIGFLNTAGSGRVQNNAEWTIYGSTVIDSNHNLWVNNGHYKTTYICYTAGINSVINNCYLEVTEDFDINLGGGAGAAGGFTNAPGAGVLTKNFNGGGNFTLSYVDLNGATQTKSHSGGPFDIRMGAKSLFKVTNTATMTGRNPGNGFFGIDTEYAVLEANEIVAGADDQGLVTYNGNLYVAANSHFEQAYKGQYALIVYQNGFTEANIYSPGFSSGSPSITIPHTPCNPGFNGDTTPPDNPVTPTTDKVRVIAEDLTTLDGKADFDFNDVVFDVELLSSGKVTITLQAAGGTLPLTVGDTEGTLESPTMEMQKDSQGNDMEEVMKYEVHRLFKVATTTMVNTNAAGGANRDAVAFEIDNPISSTNAKEIANAIPIRVYKGGQWIELAKAVPVTGTATITASKLAVDGTFGWCAERIALEKDNRYQYTDDAGNNLGSRFRMYLEGKIEGDWWLSTTKAKN